jgi:hypothetical protein
MSKFASIDLAQLATVVGGMEVTGKGKVQIGAGGGEVDVEGTYKRNSYESCLATVTSRKDWTPEDIQKTCGMPPSN